MGSVLFRDFVDQGHADVTWALWFCDCRLGCGGLVLLPSECKQLPQSLSLRVTAVRNHFYLGSLLLERSVLARVTALLGSLLSGLWKCLCCSGSRGSWIEWGRAGRLAPGLSSPFPRRNRPGDREKALAVLLPLVQSEGSVAPDLYCMCGRVYKDMFFSSGFQDAGHREQAYHW